MKLKRILSLLVATTMAVTALMGAMTASASEVAKGECGDLTWTLDSEGVLTLSGEGEMATPDFDLKNPSAGLVSSEVYDTCLVDYPDVYTYQKYKNDIKEVVIEEGVTTIGFAAFYKMPNLETVTLPSTITGFVTVARSIPERRSCAFAECTKLKNLTLTEGMTSLGDFVFDGCTSLESVRIPSTLTVPVGLDERKGICTGWLPCTFEDCTSLKNVTLPEGLTVIGAGAFKNTAVESIIIPSTIETWDKYPVDAIDALDNIAFQNCKKLSSVTFKEGLKTIWGSPFSGCPLLKKVVIPASVTDITYGFSRKEGVGLEEIAFEDGSQLTEIGVGALDECKSLKSLEIPENVTKISDNALKYIDSIKTVYVYSRTVDAYNLPANARVFCYWDSVAKSQIACSDIEDEISKALKELKTAVKEANKYSEEKYTEESYGVLKALLDKAATKNEESYILGMRSLTEDIYSAIEGLEEKKDEPSTPSDPSNPSDPSESDPSTPSDSSDPTSPSNPTTPTKPTGGNVKKTTSPAQKASEAKAAAEKAIKQAKIVSFTAKAKGKKITVSWKKVAKAVGYEVQASTKKNFKKNVINKATVKNKIVFKKLKSKKKYFVRVRAYTTYKDAKGKTQKVYSKWVKCKKKVKVK